MYVLYGRCTNLLYRFQRLRGADPGAETSHRRGVNQPSAKYADMQGLCVDNFLEPNHLASSKYLRTDSVCQHATDSYLAE